MLLCLQVIGSKYQSRLLEVIDARCCSVFLISGSLLLTFEISICLPTDILFFSFSQLPESLGGSCTCSDQGGCFRSNKGPWNDPIIVKVHTSLHEYNVHDILLVSPMV